AEETAGLQIIYLHAVHLKVVVSGERAVGAERPLRLAARSSSKLGGVGYVRCDSRRQGDYLSVVASHEGQIADQRAIGDPAQGTGFGLEHLGFGGNRHLLVDGADLELDIESGGFGYVHPQSLFDRFFEAWLHYFQAIGSWLKKRRQEGAV